MHEDIMLFNVKQSARSVIFSILGEKKHLNFVVFVFFCSSTIYGMQGMVCV